MSLSLLLYAVHACMMRSLHSVLPGCQYVMHWPTHGRALEQDWLHVQALNNLFFSGNYDWKPFIIALVASVVGMLIMGALEILVLEPLLGRVCPRYFRRRRGAAVRALQKPQDSGPAVSHVQSTENGSVYSSAYPKE